MITSAAGKEVDESGGTDSDHIASHLNSGLIGISLYLYAISDHMSENLDKSFLLMLFIPQSCIGSWL